jgi:hypothetical protein
VTIDIGSGSRRLAAAAGGALLVAAMSSALRAQGPQACTVAGTITSAGVPLPGVALTLTTADGQAVDVTSSSPDGTYLLRLPSGGTFTLTGELTAFAPIKRSLSIDAASCPQRLDLTMTLASRAPAPAAPAAGGTAAGPSSPAASRGTSAGARTDRPSPDARSNGAGARGGGGRGRGQQGQPAFQTLDLFADENGLSRADDGNPDASSSPPPALPPGFAPETSSESVASIGSSQPADAFVGRGGFADRPFGDGPFDGGFAGRDVAFAGGPGGRGGFGGPGQSLFLGRGRGSNQIRGSVFQSFDTSALDTAPFALNGQPAVKPQYLQQRFGATFGGPIAIPKLWDRARTFFFLNYTGNHSHNPYDAYSNVPTLAERSGDLSAFGRPVIDPVTGQPFAGNQIPASRIDPAARALLTLFPQPNQPGDRQNFHAVTTTTSQLDDINVRLVHVFGAPPPQQRDRGQGQGEGGFRGGFGGRGGGGFGGFGGRGGGGRQGVSNLNLAVHFRHSDNSNPNPLPTLGGTARSSALDIPVNYSFTKGGLTHAIRVQFNRQHAESQNFYAFRQDIDAAAGLFGASSDPFDWGAPGLSFTTFTSIRDVNPSVRTDRTLALGDTILKTRGQHTIRFGGDWRLVHADSRTDANARGSYVFTGFFTGSDFGDFLLGMPQQASVQYGPGTERFRQHTGDLFVQDDWRVKTNLTINAGLRYEYFSPVSEAGNRLVTLDASPAFTAAVPVAAGGTSPFSGALPATLVRPFREGFAPRVGLAWRANTTTVVRAGYGINYNASVYQSIAQQLAGQPPFAVTDTVLAARTAPLALETALQNAPAGVTTNNCGVDPNFRLPFAQIWNVDLQRDIARTYTLGIGYTGTKGTNLDVLRAPNRNPDGTLRIAGVEPFIWESSSGRSIMNALTLRFRRRLNHGVAAGAAYTLSKSMDDASSIGGTNGVVAQNDQDLAAEYGPSSFDQRHRFSGDFIVELPFGANKRWFQDGAAASLLGGWQINGNVLFASGTPFTARVLGSIRDVSTGVNGTLRANYNGAPIQLSDPTPLLFFNTSAFSIPAPGTFGTAGRNTIVGPGTSTLNMGVMKNIAFGQNRVLTFQLTASNLLNTVQYASIDTVVNSPTFGRVTAVRPMRHVQVITRFRF